MPAEPAPRPRIRAHRAGVTLEDLRCVQGRRHSYTHADPLCRRAQLMLPTNTNVTVEVQSRFPANPDALVVFLAEGGKIGGDAPQLLGEGQMRCIDRLLKAGVVRGKAKEVAFDL